MTELIVALDYPEIQAAEKLVKELAGLPVLFKVGSELFLTAGAPFVQKLTHQGQRIFLDLKFHDIPNTVAKAATQAAKMGIEMFTLHIAGGQKMIEAVVSEFESLPKGSARPKILGVTVLTSFDSSGWNDVCSSVGTTPSSIEKSVLSLTQSGAKWGLDGLVCSAHELKRMKEAAPRLWTVVPGIRPAGTSTQDQARVMTPSEAHAAGANAIVVGRPITQAKNSRDATLAILKELGRSV